MSLQLRVAALAVVVAASSAAVPALLGTTKPAPIEALPATTSTPTATTPTATTPTATPTPEPTPSPTPAAEATRTTRPSPSPSPIIFKRITIDAAAKANRLDGAKVIDCLTCLAGRRVQYLGQGHTLVIPVGDVPVAGKRTLTVVYTCGCADAPRTLDLRVNDDDPQALPLKGAGGWEDPAKATLRIRLRKGDNQILFYNNADPAPDLDRIVIS